MTIASINMARNKEGWDLPIMKNRDGFFITLKADGIENVFEKRKITPFLDIKLIDSDDRTIIFHHVDGRTRSFGLLPDGSHMIFNHLQDLIHANMEKTINKADLVYSIDEPSGLKTAILNGPQINVDRIVEGRL